MSNINSTVVRGPYNVWVAPVGSVVPTVLTMGTLDPAWKKLGARGLRSQGDSGVTVSYKQKLEEWRGQSNAIQDVSRTEEDILIAFELADISLEVLSQALNGNLVTVTLPASAVKGKKKMPNFRGSDVNPFACLIIGKSPYVVGEGALFYVPKVFNNTDIDLAFTKSSPAMTKLEFKAVEGPNATDIDADLGFWEIISAAALP
jgi:hypothetical protein